MNIIKIFVSVMCILFLAACSPKNEVYEDSEVRDAKKIVSRLHSVKHEKSGLCFAYSWGGGSNAGAVLLNMSCNKEFVYNDETEKKDAIKLVNELKFVKDEKSDTCFAYAWSGMSNGGPTLAEVPCEKVEKLLEK